MFNVKSETFSDSKMFSHINTTFACNSVTEPNKLLSLTDGAVGWKTIAKDTAAKTSENIPFPPSMLT